MMKIITNLSSKNNNHIILLSFRISLIIILLGFLRTINAQIVINEILPDGTVEIKNLGSETVDVSGIILCNFPAYQTIGNSTLDCGTNLLGAGEILAVNNFVVAASQGEMGLYTATPYSDPNNIIDYVEWGNTGHQRSAVAVEAGIWSTGDFVIAIPAGCSLAFDGEGNAATDWIVGSAPTICEENVSSGSAIIVVNEISADGKIEITNIGDAAMDVTNVILCNFPDYQTIGNSTLECGDLMLEPGEILVVTDFVALAEQGEMGLYSATPYSDPNNVMDYMEWGNTGHQRSGVAVQAGQWVEGDFAPAIAAGTSLEYDGEGDAASDWVTVSTPTICEENTGSVATIEIHELNSYQVYPNPASTTLNLKDIDSGSKIEIINLAGQVMSKFTIQGTSSTIELKNYNSGIHLVKISLLDKQSFAKVIIQKD